MSRLAMENTTVQEDALRQEMVGLLPRLRRFARSLAKDPDKADDLVQAACERALERLTQVRAGTRLDSWLYRIIYTQWIDKLRRGKTRAAKLVVLADAKNAAAAGQKLGDYLNTAMDLQRAFDTLPSEHKAAVILVSVEGYSYEEAASVLNIPVGTVASRVARARTLLGKLLTYERQQGLRQSKRHSREQGK